jgi:2TM family of unknown function (DUF5676)
MRNIRVATWSLGTFTLGSDLVCIVYGLIVPGSMHMTQFLEMTLPGFKWFTLWGFLIGVVEGFLYSVSTGWKDRFTYDASQAP